MTCPACGGTVRRWRSDIGVCRECGSSSRAAAGNHAVQESHYAGYYEVIPPLSALTVERLDQWALSLVPYRRTGRLLEVGCGAGHFLAAAARHGFEAWGTEISRSGIALLEGRGLRVLAGALPELDLPDQHFDAVVLFEVLEHLEDPGRYLCECARIVRPGGGLLVTTPNFGSLSRRLLGERWRVVDPEHLVLFTARGLGAALERSGFRCLSLASRNVDPTELLRGLRRHPVRGTDDRQARVDACRQALASRPALATARDAVNRVLRGLSLGDTLEARAER